jgi:hypothetical protein
MGIRFRERDQTAVRLAPIASLPSGVPMSYGT